jgi:hypothetical protein
VQCATFLILSAARALLAHTFPQKKFKRNEEINQEIVRLVEKIEIRERVRQGSA